ncbi:MAG: hypothetical protein RSC07_01195 [Mucinivorans sp.]
MAQLLTHCKSLEQRCQAQKITLTQLTATVQSQREKIEELDKRNTVLLLSGSISEISGAGKVARARINTMIRDIDRALAIINR